MRDTPYRSYYDRPGSWEYAQRLDAGRWSDCGSKPMNLSAYWRAEWELREKRRKAAEKTEVAHD